MCLPYRRAHANRGRETESEKLALRGWRIGKRTRSTRRERLRSEREATCFEAPSHRATGGHGWRSDRAETKRAPQLRTWRKSGGVRRGHGLPGQRERRRGVNGAGQPADRGSVSVSGGRATDRGERAAPSSGNRCGAERQRSWATSRPGFDSGDGGWATSRSGRGGNCRRATGESRRTAAGSGNRTTGRKRASPAEPLGVTTGDVIDRDAG